MPTYEYKCLKCERRLEIFQSMQDAPLKTCEACGGKLKRLIGKGAGIIFKGSGFYCTDYRSDSYRSAAKSDAAAPAGSTDSKSTATTPAKTETPPAKPSKPDKP